MASTWKILAVLALFLTLPAGAYVTGAMVGPPSPPEHQAQLVDQDADVPRQPARKAKARPTARPAEDVTATGTGPATVVRDQPGPKVDREKPGPTVEREKAEKRQPAERKPDATEEPTGDADNGNQPAADPAPSESPEPTEGPETEDPEPTASPTPTPTDDAEPEPAEPTTSVAPSDEPEDAAGR